MVSNHEQNLVAVFLYTGGFLVSGLTGPDSNCWRNVKRDWNDVYKQLVSMGICVTHIRKNANTNNWDIVLDSSYNKKYNMMTPFRIDGPLSGHYLMKTKFSQDGTQVLGTFNNCGSQMTPWGTFLSAEENCWFAMGCTNSQDPVTGRTQTELAMLNRYNYISTGSGVTRSNWFAYYGGAGGTIDSSYTFFAGYTGYSGPTGDKNGYSSPWLMDCVSTGYTSSPLYGTTLMPTGSFESLDYTCYGTTGTEDFRNQVHCMNWIKEIDPMNPSQIPRVRTALGRRFAENSQIIAEEGKPVVVYINDDSRSEYFYKFISDTNWTEADRNGGIAIGDKYLNTGTLYVARFYNASVSDNSTYGTGAWINLKTLSYPLTYGYGSSAATTFNVVINDYTEALCFSRSVGDFVQATRLDRSEWSALDKRNNIIYTALTANRDIRTITAGSSTGSSWGYSRGNAGVSSISPRCYRDFSSENALSYSKTGTSSDNNGNQNGGIFRLKCYSGAQAHPAGLGFRFDHFAFGCSPACNTDPNINLSKLNSSNYFSMPDTVIFGEYSGQKGYMVICTDDSYIKNSTNNQALIAYIPASADIGDGKAVTVISQTSADFSMVPTGATGTARTFIGKQQPISRFLVGVPNCEVTGWTETPDGTTAFIGIQHPGITQANPVLSTQYPLLSNGLLDMRSMFLNESPNGEYTNPGTSFPSTQWQRPRSTILAISRKDGNPIL